MIENRPSKSLRPRWIYTGMLYEPNGPSVTNDPFIYVVLNPWTSNRTLNHHSCVRVKFDEDGNIDYIPGSIDQEQDDAIVNIKGDLGFNEFICHFLKGVEEIYGNVPAVEDMKNYYYNAALRWFSDPKPLQSYPSLTK